MAQILVKTLQTYIFKHLKDQMDNIAKRTKLKLNLDCLEGLYYMEFML